MMKLDNDNVEPVTDLQLALAYQNQFTPRRLSNSGAGANADSRIDLAFVAADPLSELVWSPHNGLSLKCADFSFFEEKTSLLWDVGPSNMVLSPPQGATSRVATGEEPIDEGNLITSQVAFQVANVIDEGPSLVRSPRSIGYNARSGKNRKQNLYHSKLAEEHTDLSVAIEEEHKNKMKIDGPINVPPPEKLGSSAENELQLLIVKGKSTPPEAPPNNSRTGLNRRKRKEKAFSDGNVNERTSKDEDGSHESVESCNSAVPVLFSTGKKRWSFEQLTVESKRMKKQIREDEVPSLALTLSHPDHEDKSADQKIITCRRNNDIGCMNMGFQTIFQSLYSSNPNKQERKMLIGNSPIRMSKHVVLDNKLSGACITPMSCYGDFDEFCKKIVLPEKKFNKSISGNEAGPSVKPNTSAANIVTSSCSDQNKISRKLACTSVKYGRNSSFSRGKHKIESDENNDSDPPRYSEGINKVGGRCDDLENFWITRFSSKTSGTVLNLDECNLNTSKRSCVPLIARTLFLVLTIASTRKVQMPRSTQLKTWKLNKPIVKLMMKLLIVTGKTLKRGVGKNIASSSGNNVLKEKKIALSSQLVAGKFSDVPKGIFDGIRKLRLSRMDILKWMNSQTSSLHLDGFFLRLRLGKWEEGLGGTGYYVACITGEQRGKPPQGSKIPLFVKIGGIKCLVESQYISNQDFLEDELMVWWCATVRSGGKIPSEDHLKSKFKERQRLDF
ncbi:zinc knuckle (CCHC-type) family protein [Actinidia rufa]|uniref:Zinc knuckle (CCHC-type) family protein n=1 Tax=Actinidia rufa TaxID=165716 RepID=A0A7J0GTI4_9ERIC|nr:zinc knuckle (CCHC-type) family protein [Actinidia rufa]